MRFGICIAISAGMIWAAPVRVTLEGTISAISMDALGMADSLGLTVGSPVSYELEIDYNAQPVLVYQNIIQSWNDTTSSNGDSIDYFKVRLLSGRKTRVTQTVVGSQEMGVFAVSGPSHPGFGLISRLLGPIGTTYSFTTMCQEPSGRLLESTSGCLASETMTQNSAIVFAFNVNIGTIRVQGGPTALGPALPNRNGRGIRLTGNSVFIFKGRSVSMDGRIR